MRTSARSFVAACAAALAAGLLLPVAMSAAPAAAQPGDVPEFNRVLAGIPSARKALANAKDVIAGRAPAEDLTLALRDLAARLPEYRGQDRTLVERLLARPNGGNKKVENALGAAWPGAEASNSPFCGVTPDICVHWTDTSVHQPPAQDVNTNDVPDQVETTLTQMTNVWQAEVNSFGYRAPLTDQRASKDEEPGFDVYLSDIGGGGYYGYCAIDDSRTFQNYNFYDRSGYCVVDDDFSAIQFPFHTPLQNLQVTAAHEFFHAIQFAYDAYEDPWFMEGTAAWVEDEVFDAVNDNRQYLTNSQFRRPDKPVDTAKGITVYGSWGFFRYLSEHFDQDVVLKAWQRADGSSGGPDDYSLLGVRKAIKAKGAKLGGVFANYARANLAPAEYYDEGAEGTGYPSPTVGAKSLGGAKKSTGWLNSRIDHMAIAYRSAKPNANTAVGAKLRVKVDAPARKTGAQARVLVKYANGTYAARSVALDGTGYGTVKVDFGRTDVRRVYVGLVNASDSFRKCYRFKTQYSCGGGIPRHDNRRYAVKLSLA